MVGCAMRSKMPTGRYFHGAHGAPYFDKTLNLLPLDLHTIIRPLLFCSIQLLAIRNLRLSRE